MNGDHVTMTEPGTELAPLGPTGMPLIPPSPEAAAEAMRVYQEISAALITPKDMQKIGRTEFPKRSAFQKLGNAYRVSTQIVKDIVDYDDAGQLVRARITVRATHPDGRFTEGDGTCTASERSRDDTKLEHDVHGTAVTRAKNRAISDLVAFGAVSAEEAEAGSPGGEVSPPSALPAWAAPVTDIGGVAEALVGLLTMAGSPTAAAQVGAIGQAIFDDCDDTIPVCVFLAIGHISAALRSPVEPSPVASEMQEPPEASPGSPETETTGEGTTEP